MSYLTSDEFLASIEKGFEATTDLKPVPVPESLRYDPSDASLKRQLSFGFAQGDMTLGSIGRVFSSAYDSLTKGGSFKLNSELNNMQRQLDIKAEYPEFKNLSPEDYTAAMTVGEVSNYVFDPVLLAAYALVPGGMAARAAQFSAYEGGAEALRQVGRKGTVDDPVSVAVTASVAGVASLGLDKVFPYFKDKASKESKELIEEVIEEAEDVVNSAPILTQADHVRNWWKNALDETTLANQNQLATLRGRAAVGEDVSQADFVRAWYNSSKGGTDKTVKVEPTLTEGEEQIVRTSVANVKEPAKKVAFEDMNIQQRLISLSKVDLIINKLNQKLANPKILKNPAIYEKRLENALRHKESLQKNITVDMMNTAEKKAASFADTIDDIAEKGELSNKILSVLLAEATRPVVGATGGGVIGNMFDDDGDHNWTYYGMAAGAGFGFLSRRLNASPYLTEIQKETGDLIIGDAYKSLAGRTMAKLKIMTSSTLATKMDAAGGWTKAIGNKLFSRIGQGDANSVEFRVQQLHADFFEKLNSVVELPEVKKIVEQLGSLTEKNILKVTESNRTINTLAGEVMRGFIDAGSLKVGYKGIAGNLKPVTAEEIASVRKAVVGYQEQMDYVKKLVENSGIRIKEDLGEDYGLPQLWDIDRASVEFVDFVEDLEVAIGIQVRNNGKKLNADNFAGSVTSKPAFRDNASFRGSQIFDVDPVSGLRTFRKAANYFENARQLTDQEAVKYLAQKGWLKLDAQEVLTEYGMQTIKVAEFAKTFGPNGELINLALNRIGEACKNQAKGLNPEAARKLSSERVNQENMLIDGVEAFWGRYGRPLQGEVGQTATTSIRTLQAMANMQYLSTVSIANLPDLLQPFINSNFGTAAKAAFAKPSERFSKLSNFKYDTTWEREILNFTSGGMIETRGQAFLANIQDIFFRGVGLKKVTQVARNFAYDVGANRAYSLANKIKVGKKLTKSEVNELKSLGLDGDNLKALSKYKNITEAFDDVQGGRVFLDIAGRISADRDAIIPLVGNRLLFTQHNNAAIRAMGQFLSWTMAKSAQLNKILSRVENGDARLALKMVSAIPIYGALREFKGMVNPGTAKDAYEDEDYLDKVLRSLKISGQTSYWAADKIAEGLKYNVSSRNNFTGGIAPAIGYLEESLKAIATASGKDNFQEAAKEVGETVPLVSQAIDIAEKYSKGGEVFVPNAPIEPDERIDKMTGLPYDVQAGIPFIDEEDPLKRLGLVGGGSVAYVDPLQRMGFGLGGAVTKLVKSFTKLSGDDATGTFETVAAKELADATPDGSVDDVAKSLNDVSKIKAYHGSSHDFDEFSTKQIGTGEGAQAYGHGLYFAEAEDVAKGYRDQLTPRDLDYEEELLRRYTAAEKNQDYTRMEMLERAMMHDEPRDFRAIAADADYDDDYRQVASEFADEIEKMNPNIGRMYQVDIDASPDEFLDYDLPMQQQSKKVKTALLKIDADPELKKMLALDETIKQLLQKSPPFMEKLPRPLRFSPKSQRRAYAGSIENTGEGFIDMLRTGIQRPTYWRGRLNRKQAAQGASELLNELGIKGIRYKDGFSRGKKEGTFNYVIFDDRLISISKKYGIAIPAAAILLSKETGENPESFYQRDNSIKQAKKNESSI